MMMREGFYFALQSNWCQEVFSVGHGDAGGAEDRAVS
jgi:hypothetical protein